MIAVACSGRLDDEIKRSQASYFSHMEKAVSHLNGDRWQSAVEAAERGKASLSDGGGGLSDGNLEYLRIQATAFTAWAKLASGAVEDADRRYQAVFADLQEYEQSRSNALEEKVEGSQTFSAVVSGLSAFGNALGTGGGSGFGNFAAAMEGVRVTTMQLATASMPSGTETELFGGSQLQPDGVRLTVLPAFGALTNIGRFRTGSKWCTASLIGPALALTNAHCVTNAPTENGVTLPGKHPVTNEPMWIVFDGIYMPDLVKVERVHLNRGQYWDKQTREARQNDWAIMELDRHPVGRGYFGIADPEDYNDQDLMIAGHSGDLNDGRFLTMHWGCSGRVRWRAGYVDHACIRAPGASGSPILMTEGDMAREYVLGVHAFGISGKPLGGGPNSAQFINTVKQLREQAELTPY